jgi:hypothetical protein
MRSWSRRWPPASTWSCTRLPTGRAAPVREITAVPGRVEQDVVEVAVVVVWRGDRLTRADGYPPHADRFVRAGYDLTGLLGSGGSQHARRGVDGLAV